VDLHADAVAVTAKALSRRESRLFGKEKDPTSDWPAAGQAPVLDLERQSVGPLRLGDSFEGAKALGRPKRLGGAVNGGNFLLDYATFELEFQDGRLVCVKFDIDGPASVNVVGDIRLSRATKPLDAQAWFGEPESDSTGGGGLRWIDFLRDGATLALEFDAKGLSCVQLYAEGYA
jgi:hypothetical protein